MDKKFFFPVPSWANKISLRDAPANPENGGLIMQDAVNISLSLGIAFSILEVENFLRKMAFGRTNEWTCRHTDGQIDL